MKYPPIEDIYDLVHLAIYFRDPKVCAIYVNSFYSHIVVTKTERDTHTHIYIYMYSHGHFSTLNKVRKWTIAVTAKYGVFYILIAAFLFSCASDFLSQIYVQNN